jgi:hypothetical protein
VDADEELVVDTIKALGDENLVISTDWPTAIPLFHRLSIPFSRSTACPTSPGAKFFGTTARDFTTFALDLWTQVPS